MKQSGCSSPQRPGVAALSAQEVTLPLERYEDSGPREARAPRRHAARAFALEAAQVEITAAWQRARLAAADALDLQRRLGARPLALRQPHSTSSDARRPHRDDTGIVLWPVAGVATASGRVGVRSRRPDGDRATARLAALPWPHW